MNLPALSGQKERLGLYFHWPFCLSKCPYCDFNTHISDSVEHDVWLGAYLKAMEHYAAQTQGRAGGRRLDSIFFGGGTPSLMPAEMIGAILDKAAALWEWAGDIEITLEANPTSVEIDKFKGFAAAGVNRVSLGVQALNDDDLKFLGREHSHAEALAAIDVAKACFDRVSFDLIYARPDQSLGDWEEELRRAAEIAQGHLSLYQLTIERNTPFYYSQEQGDFVIPNQDVAADFYALTQDVLTAAGLPAYEVSNHAAAGDESRHNLIYWQYQDYIGIGPGAHGRLSLDGDKYATRDHPAPGVWLEHAKEHGHGAHERNPLSARDQAFESLMMGLRLNAGMAIGNAHWQYLSRDKLKVIQEQGWVDYSPSHMRLTQEGLLRLNAILPFIFEQSA